MGCCCIDGRRTTGGDVNATIGVVDCGGDGRTVQGVRGGLCHSMCRGVATVLSALQYIHRYRVEHVIRDGDT